jgi:hypothetical protein
MTLGPYLTPNTKITHNGSKDGFVVVVVVWHVGV